jgi:hypothetical protein
VVVVAPVVGAVAGAAALPQVAALPPEAPLAVRMPAVAAVAAGREGRSLAVAAVGAEAAPRAAVPAWVQPPVGAAAVPARAKYP